MSDDIKIRTHECKQATGLIMRAWERERERERNMTAEEAERWKASSPPVVNRKRVSRLCLVLMSCRWVFIYTWHLSINSDTWLCFPLQNTDTVFIPSLPQTIFNPHAAWPQTHDASFMKACERVDPLIHLRPHPNHLHKCAGDHLQRQPALSEQNLKNVMLRNVL